MFFAPVLATIIPSSFLDWIFTNIYFIESLIGLSFLFVLILSSILGDFSHVDLSENKDWLFALLISLFPLLDGMDPTLLHRMGFNWTSKDNALLTRDVLIGNFYVLLGLSWIFSLTFKQWTLFIQSHRSFLMHAQKKHEGLNVTASRSSMAIKNLILNQRGWHQGLFLIAFGAFLVLLFILIGFPWFAPHSKLGYNASESLRIQVMSLFFFYACWMVRFTFEDLHGMMAAEIKALSLQTEPVSFHSVE